jgi:hypothetical protein
MELNITISDEFAISQIIELKTFIDETLIEEIEETVIERSTPVENQLGVGEILNSITIIIKATTKPLTELSKALRDYVNIYRTTIKIILPDGTKIIIDKGRSLSAKDIQNIIKASKS